MTAKKASGQPATIDGASLRILPMPQLKLATIEDCRREMARVYRDARTALILPEQLRSRFKEELEFWLQHAIVSGYLHEHEINQTQRLIDYLDVVKTPHSDSFDMPSLLNDFKQFYTQYDQRRGKNFAETFPVMKNWYNSL